MSRAILPLVLALAAAGAAQAADYVVVASSEASLKPGLTLDAGQRVALPAGQTLTLMSGGGEVVTLRGAAAGVTAPSRRRSDDGGRVQALAALIAPPPTSRQFGGRRGGICPPASELQTVDQILAAQQGACQKQARAALEALIAQASP
ncbi:MAG: hypothetical protein JNK30_10480 [Phenylobacterium sp.]|uniref:hypothetical protein n=1 Tax=Phenylobacterium sp. TaxID=1871053 RepID=UPI001A4B2922|nr:hypothetical protein [Phenylobacterium sp.]MBL8771797.1 hypothetical protein [Phenylobacterium sp.]